MADSILSAECLPARKATVDEVLFDGSKQNPVDTLLLLGGCVLAHAEQPVAGVAHLGQLRARHALDVDLHQGLENLPALARLECRP
jgi:hypothetical protein